MTILASAATALFAAGSVSADVINKADFESYAAGVFDSTVADDGEGTTDGRFWYCATTGVDSGLVVTNYDSQPGVDVPVQHENRPDVFQGEPNSQFLSLDTTTPLYRRTAAIGTSESTPEEFVGVEIPAGGSIYLDTLVKFTAAEAPFAENLDSGDKIAISYVAGADEFDGVTNFVIRAGYIGVGQIVQTNYFAAVPDGFDLAAWHRLTVRTLSNIDGNDNVGFAVYVDQTPLAYSAVALVEGSPANAGFNAGEEDPDRTIFPSAIAGLATGGKTIAAASFSGSGCIDDVVFTTTKPAFIPDNKLVTINWDEYVTGLTINGEPVSAEDLAELKMDVEPVDGVVTVSATFADGYTAGDNYVDGAGDWSNGSFVDLVGGDKCYILSMQKLFQVGDVFFDDIDDAIEAAVEEGTAETPATLKLLADYNGALSFTEGYIILDLAGCDVQGGDDADFSLVNGGATLIITNSGAAASVKLPTSQSATAVVYTAAGITKIQAGKFEGLVATAADGDDEIPPQDRMVITGGQFLDSAYDPDAEEPFFYLAKYVATGVGYEKLAGTDYVQVGAAPVIPTTFALTTSGGAHADVTTSPSDVSALTEETEVTITATADENYTYDGVDLTDTGWVYNDATDSISKTVTVSEDTEVVVPDAVAEQEPPASTWTVTLTLGDHVNSVSYSFVDDLATTNTLSASGSFTIEKNKSFVFVGVGVDENYELDIVSTTNSIVGATIDQYFVITPTADATGTIYAKSTQQGGYPTYIGDDTAKQAKYDEWAKTYGADADSQYEEAFLLNCAPADVETEKAAFKLNITVDGTTVTVTTPEGKSYNGTVQLKGSNDLSTWTNVDSASTSYNFYKAELK